MQYSYIKSYRNPTEVIRFTKPFITFTQPNDTTYETKSND